MLYNIDVATLSIKKVDFDIYEFRCMDLFFSMDEKGVLEWKVQEKKSIYT